MQQREEGIVSYMATHETIDPNQYIEDRNLQQFEQDPIAFAFKSSSDPDTMYYHEAMKQTDAPKFRQAMTKEVDAHTEKMHWKVVRRSAVPKGVRILPAVWAMKRKRRQTTGEKQ